MLLLLAAGMGRCGGGSEALEPWLKVPRMVRKAQEKSGGRGGAQGGI